MGIGIRWPVGRIFEQHEAKRQVQQITVSLVKHKMAFS